MLLIAKESGTREVLLVMHAGGSQQAQYRLVHVITHSVVQLQPLASFDY